MSTFLKEGQVVLLNGGYVSNKETKAPVNNADFIAAQKRAEYVVTFARHCKNKNFTANELDCLSDVKSAVAEELAAMNKVEFVKSPKKVTKKLSDQLADEALAFVKWEEDSTKVDKINGFLSEFTIIKDFEAHGLFFDDGIVKLNKIYSIKDITKAVEQTIDLIA